MKIEEVEAKNPDVKFALKIMPFEATNFIVIIEFLHKVDMLRVIASVGVGKILIEDYKTKTDPEKIEINQLFSKPIRERDFNPMIAKDFAAVEGFKLLIQQNFSPQMLLDTVMEAGFILQELGDKFRNADQSAKVPKVSEAAKSMFG